MKIPNPNWVQSNKGEIYGNLNASWNLDLLSNPGKARVSPYVIPQTYDISGLPTAFVKDPVLDRQYALCGEYLYYWTGSAWDAMANLIALNNPTCSLYYSDIAIFNGLFLVSVPGEVVDSISKLASETWTTSWLSISLTRNLPHPMCAGKLLLLIGNGNTITTVDTSNNVDTSAVVLPTEFVIEWIKRSSNGYWIGTKNIRGGEAEVFFWDGYSENYNTPYKVGSESCFSGVIDKTDVPYVVNGYGQLLKFTGSGFQEVARFQIADSKTHYLQGYLTTAGLNPIHRNGMSIIDNKVHILISPKVDGDSTKWLENQLSGIWCFTDENGLHHRYSLGKNDGSNRYDYGSPILAGAGALSPLPKRSGSFYAGYTTYATGLSGTELPWISALDTSDTTRNKMGYLVTPWIEAQELDEMWNSINLVFKKLQNSTDFIRIKYRFEKKYNDLATMYTGTWISTTEFTVASVGDLEVGDEVEIMSGIGSGLSSKITDIDGTTITIEDIMVSGTGTFSFRTEAWTELETVQDLVSVYKDVGIGSNSPRVQFKIISFGKGDSPELSKLIINSGKQI